MLRFTVPDIVAQGARMGRSAVERATVLPILA